MTKAQLRAYKDMRDERDKLNNMIVALESILYGPKAPNLDGMPRSGSANSDIRDDRLDKVDELRKMYTAVVDKLDRQMKEIEEAIVPLDPRERTLIRLHYFEGKTWEQVAVEMNYTWRHVHRLHGQALEKLQAEDAKCG